MNRYREIRRYAGALAAGLGRMGFRLVDDPRNPRRVTWLLWQVLNTITAALAGGCRSLAEAEELSEELSPPIRRKLGIRGRVPDTTMRDVVMVLGNDIDGLREILHRQNRAAWRSHQLYADGLPHGVVAIDGKHTATHLPDDVYAQAQGGSYLVRTLTAALVSAPATSCLDAWPIPKERSESSAFRDFVPSLLGAYGATRMFEVITSDAGIGDEPNARMLNDDYGLGYVFAIKDDQPTLLDEASRQLGNLGGERASASTTDVVDNQTALIRRLWLTTEMDGYHWRHLRTVLRVEAEKRREDGTVVARENRYFVSNLAFDSFTPDEWLRVVRWHWRVENDCHQTFDVAFEEDERPWLKAARGMLVLMLLRRVVFNLLTVHRNVSRRGEQKGRIPWRRMFTRMKLMLGAATDEHIAGLRWPSAGRASGRGPPRRCAAT